MKAIIITVVFVIGACTTSESPSDDTMEDPSSCVPRTCAEANVGCGSISDGCGQMITCGAPCAEGTDCLPKSCDNKCGAMDNGCGVSMDCGGCGSGESCNENTCVNTSCGGVGTNACGTCGDLPLEPMQQCPCGTAAFCSSGIITCEGGKTYAAPNTTDGVDTWTQINGTISAVADAEEMHHTYLQQYDQWTFEVADTFTGLMQPQLEVLNPTGTPLIVCFKVSYLDVSHAACADGDTSIEHDYGCCKKLAAGQTSARLDLELNWGIPDIFDDSLNVGIEVRPGELAANAAPSCASYSLRYRF